MNNNLNQDKINELRESLELLIQNAQSDKDIRMGTYALNDLATSIKTLAPYKEEKKITIFGSARLKEDTLEYKETFNLASRLSKGGFVVITGGGPGLMHAGLDGAAGNGVGIAIELPFETVNKEVEILNGWPLARQQMFFTRKLALIRNVNGFIVAPGGFGTLDEFFEVITLIQTGKSKPAPVVLFEVKGSPMWSELNEFIETRLMERGLIDSADKILYHITDDIDDAYEYIANFWSNYQGAHINGDIVKLKYMSKPLESLPSFVVNLRSVSEVIDFNDNYIAFKFDLRHWCELHLIINEINKK